MPKQIISDAIGEILETGKATVQAGKQVLTGIDKAEKGTPPVQSQRPKNSVDPDAQVEAQIERMKAVDKKQSAENYKQIQDQITMIRRQKAAQPRKYVSGVSGYDETQHKDPETFWDKVKKKKEEMAKKLPWTSKQGMGTGEIRRGASG